MESPTPFDSEAPLGSRRAIIRRNPDDASEIEMVEATWGSDPRFGGGTTYRFVRSEGQNFARHRCLIPASEFHMTVGEKRYRVTLDDGNHFYLAGIWEPAMADWPLCYRVITVAANPEVARYQERHGAIILRRQVKAWLDGTVPDIDLLVTPPARTFDVREIGATGRSKPVQTMLGL
jgi:putative SOS response-associated peptidase YedK